MTVIELGLFGKKCASNYDIDPLFSSASGRIKNRQESHYLGENELIFEKNAPKVPYTLTAFINLRY